MFELIYPVPLLLVGPTLLGLPVILTKLDFVAIRALLPW
jgi:hypothetical protein